MNSCGLLWSDGDVLNWKAEKAIGAMLAVGNTLQARGSRTQQEDEFLALLQWTKSVSSKAFNIAASAPTTYHWARLAFQLLSGIENDNLTEEPRAYFKALNHRNAQDAFDFHLDQFKLFVLALAITDGTEISFEPFHVQLPVAIPTTPWSFDGDAELQISGVTAPRNLSTIVDGVPAEIPLPSASMEWNSRLSIHMAPTIQLGDNRIVLQPHAFALPDLPSMESVVPIGIDFQRDSLDHVLRAMAAIQLYDETTYLQFSQAMKVIAFKPESAGGVANTSCSRLPGAAIFTASKHPLVLAEDLIHEFYHNRLFAIEESSDFFAPGEFDPVSDEKFYSPWRQDSRPFYGLLHAEYVFDRVLKFWLGVMRATTSLDSSSVKYAKCRILMLREQLRLTTMQLRTFAKFTKFGQELFDRLDASIGESLGIAASLDICGDEIAWTPLANGRFNAVCGKSGPPLTVTEVLDRHIQQFDRYHRCQSLNGDRPCSDLSRSAMGAA